MWQPTCAVDTAINEVASKAYKYQYGTKVILGQPIDNNFVANDAVNELLIFSFHFARFIQNHSFVVIDPTCDGFRQILFASKKSVI